jgi:hypothetical protein
MALIVSHATGHDLAGFGGAIKNLAMGLASRAGKLRQHEAGKPDINGSDCIACGTCARLCPVDAIEVQAVAELHQEPCLGCGQCLAACPVGAVTFSWSESPRNFNEKMAEVAYGVTKGRGDSVGYVTFLCDITEDCNCVGHEMDRICPDLGVLAGADPVAIDQAAVDLINEQGEGALLDELWPESNYRAQMEHGERIGLGSRDYELVGL